MTTALGVVGGSEEGRGGREDTAPLGEAEPDKCTLPQSRGILRDMSGPELGHLGVPYTSWNLPSL